MFTQGIIEQSLLFFPFICSIYFSYIVLKITDVSVDGTIVLGAAITSKLLISSVNPFLALLIAMISGFIAGICVALIQYKDSINDIISGLLMSFILYSINLNIMGKPHIVIMHSDNFIKILKVFSNNPKLIIVVLSSILTLIICLSVMYTKLGLKLRGFGENKKLMKKLGLNPELYRMIGLGISGGLASFCGSITSQIYGYADINMGFGMAITSIGALIIGIHLVSKVAFFRKKLSNHSAGIELFSCFIGIFCYFCITNSLIYFEVDQMNFKLIVALIVISSLKLAKKSGIAN